MKNLSFILLLAGMTFCTSTGQETGGFWQEIRTNYAADSGLGREITAITVTDAGQVWAASQRGLAVLNADKWQAIDGIQAPVWALATNGAQIAALAGTLQAGKIDAGKIYLLDAKGIRQELALPATIACSIPGSKLAFPKDLFLATAGKLLRYESAKKLNDAPKIIDLPAGEIRQIAVLQNSVFVAQKSGLVQVDLTSGKTESVFPRDQKYSWAPFDVRGVAGDQDGKLWFASPQGVGVLGADWQLFTGQEGLPYHDFTAAAAGEKGVVWFGTHKGAIRFDSKTWEYRQGQRWLADDDVIDLAIAPNGDAWFATNQGVTVIRRVRMTLAEKAKWYEDEIDRYHRRTPFQYVLEVSLKHPGDKSRFEQHDSDNDGLWTSMYGAGECFAYAATKDPLAKKRAKQAFEALRFLGQVTQGGTHPASKGFVARTILPTSGFNPNDGRLEGDIRHQKYHDKLWKVFEPRWPVSADGKWYWKTDTSSDELDGHYFFYAQYFDLVADTPAEKTRVREHVQALTDHLIDHDFMLVDHDGKPTRWARYNPDELNFDQNWFMERGLNSLSMLSYLVTTAHITGDARYQAIADSLVKKHSYLQNLINQKFQRGIGTGNHSDDEMAFMCYYNLMKYESDPQRKAAVGLSFWLNWKMEQPEMNPFFNFAFAAHCLGQTFADAWGDYSLAPDGAWLDDAMETLKRFPLDRFDWRHENSHRLDLLRLHPSTLNFDASPENFAELGYRNNGKVIPVDECYFNHWNRNPWELNTGGSGHEMGTGTVFLLPYYMGLYHGFIK